MKDKIKLFITKILQTVGDAINKVINLGMEKRVTLGVSIVVATIIYITLIGDGNNGVVGSIIAAFIGVFGLYIIVPNMDTLNKMTIKVAFAIIKAFAAIIAIYEITIFYNMGIYSLNNLQKIVFAVCIFVAIMYIVSMAITAYKIMKRIIDFVMQKINLDAIENGTKSIDEIAKNLASIAGMLVVIYQFFKPIIKSILGL